MILITKLLIQMNLHESINLKKYRPAMYNRHVQKTPFVINLLGWLTFICILIPRTIFDLNFWITIYFQGCPKPFYYTKENAKNTKENLAV